MNITIDDTSPRIEYYSALKNINQSWSRAEEKTDSGIVNYYGQTFTVTKGEGDRMVFRFNGSAIWVYGSKWFNHGWFSVEIDDRDPVLKIDTAPKDRVYQALLHYEGGLDVSREHEITLTNLAGDVRSQQGLEYYLDIDYIVVQQPTTSRIYTTQLDDTSPRIQYTGAWSADSHPDGLTGHISTRRGDTGSLVFNGSSVEFFGTLFPDHGNYTVAIDGVNKGMFNGSSRVPIYNVSLFSASGLQETQHTLLITNLGAPPGDYFDIDRIVFNSTIDPSLIPFPSSPAIQQPSERSHAALAGGVTGGFAVLLAIIGLAWLVWRRKRRRREEARREAVLIDLTGEEVKPFRAGSPGDRHEVQVSEASLPVDLAERHTAQSATNTTSPLLLQSPSTSAGYLDFQIQPSSSSGTDLTALPMTTASTGSTTSPTAVSGITQVALSPASRLAIDRKATPTASGIGLPRETPGGDAAHLMGRVGDEGRTGIVDEGRNGEGDAEGMPPPYEAATGRI